MYKIILVAASFFVYPALHAQSIDPVSLIIAKVIKAIDLKVQKMQNETIWLQQAQQLAEQELSKSKLAEIGQWQQKQELLYADYFTELKNVKSSVTGLSQVKRIMDLGRQVIQEFGRFGRNEQLEGQYENLLAANREIMQTLQLVVSSGPSMKDADRIVMITTLRDAMNQCLKNIKSLNTQNISMTAARERIKADLQFVKRLNGVQ